LEEHIADNFRRGDFYYTCEEIEMHQFQAKDTKGEDNFED
jgi:hypothetical protein